MNEKSEILKGLQIQYRNLRVTSLRKVKQVTDVCCVLVNKRLACRNIKTPTRIRKNYKYEMKMIKKLKSIILKDTSEMQNGLLNKGEYATKQILIFYVLSFVVKAGFERKKKQDIPVHIQPAS